MIVFGPAATTAADDEASPAAVAAAEHEFRFRILGSRPAGPAAVSPKTTTTTAAASSTGPAHLKKEEPSQELDDPTVGDETLVHLGDTEYTHVVDAAAEDGGEGGGASPALGSTSGTASSAKMAASERILDDKVRLVPALP